MGLQCGGEIGKAQSTSIDRPSKSASESTRRTLIAFTQTLEKTTQGGAESIRLVVDTGLELADTGIMCTAAGRGRCARSAISSTTEVSTSCPIAATSGVRHRNAASATTRWSGLESSREPPPRVTRIASIPRASAAPSRRSIARAISPAADSPRTLTSTTSSSTEGIDAAVRLTSSIAATRGRDHGDPSREGRQRSLPILVEVAGGTQLGTQGTEAFSVSPVPSPHAGDVEHVRHRHQWETRPVRRIS